MSLDLNLAVALQGSHTNVLDLALASLAISSGRNLVYTDGVGPGQVNQFWSDRRNIGASGTDSLDLSGTALQNAFGINIAFARVKLIIVLADPTNVNNVRVQRPAATGLTLFQAVSDAIDIHPGGLFVWGSPGAAGIPITGGSSDLLEIVNSAGGTAVNYDILIAGALT